MFCVASEERQKRTISFCYLINLFIFREEPRHVVLIRGYFLKNIFDVCLFFSSWGKRAYLFIFSFQIKRKNFGKKGTFFEK